MLGVETSSGRLVRRLLAVRFTVHDSILSSLVFSLEGLSAWFRVQACGTVEGGLTLVIAIMVGMVGSFDT